VARSRSSVTVAAIIAAVTLAACGSPSDDPVGTDEPDEEVAEEIEEADEAAEDEAPPVADDQERAYLLAAIDTGDRDPDEATVAPYRSALDAAVEVCDQDDTEVADIAVRATQLAAENGQPTTIMEMLEAIGGAVPPEAAPMDCTEVAAGILTLMESGS
jgi:hypothetical protein